MLLSEDDRELILSNITKIMSAKLDSKELDREQAREISKEVLYTIDSLTTHEQAHDFLLALSEKYKVFSDLAVIEQGIIKRSYEETAYQGAAGKIRSGDIEGALEELKTATSN